MWRKITDAVFHKEHFWRRTLAVIPAVILMGFALSWLLPIDLGADPFTMMNKAISGRIGISLGSWQALLNCILLVFVLIFGGRNLGVGTLANMLLVGYSVDFFSWVWSRVLPANFFAGTGVRMGVLFPALALFILAAAFYMAVDMGTSPYDAIPFIIARRIKKLPFRLIRIGYDFAVIGIACAFGGKLQIVTVLMALSLGPVVTWVSGFGSRVFPKLFGAASAAEGSKNENV